MSELVKNTRRRALLPHRPGQQVRGQHHLNGLFTWPVDKAPSGRTVAGLGKSSMLPTQVTIRGDRFLVQVLKAEILRNGGETSQPRDKDWLSAS
jgi:hypothetical protein